MTAKPPFQPPRTFWGMLYMYKYTATVQVKPMHCDCHTFYQNYKYVSQTFLDRLLMQGGGSSCILSNLSINCSISPMFRHCLELWYNYQLLSLFILSINLDLGYSSGDPFILFCIQWAFFSNVSFWKATSKSLSQTVITFVNQNCYNIHKYAVLSLKECRSSLNKITLFQDVDYTAFLCFATSSLSFLRLLVGQSCHLGCLFLAPFLLGSAVYFILL